MPEEIYWLRTNSLLSEKIVKDKWAFGKKVKLPQFYEKKLKFNITFLFVISISCAPIPNKTYVQIIEPKIDIQQTKNIAIELMKSNYSEIEYLKDSVSVHETKNNLKHWEVWIRRTKNQKPPYFIIYVDKTTGEAEDISDRLE